MLDVFGLSHAYGRHEALDEVNIRLRAGEAVAILGELNLLLKTGYRLDQLTYIEQKRVELARALATRPRVLLLDEWLSGLSPGELDGGMSVVWSLAAQGIAVILVEHVMTAVRALCSRVVVMNEIGRASCRERVYHPV